MSSRAWHAVFMQVRLCLFFSASVSVNYSARVRACESVCPSVCLRVYRVLCAHALVWSSKHLSQHVMVVQLWFRCPAVHVGLAEDVLVHANSELQDAESFLSSLP